MNVNLENEMLTRRVNTYLIYLKEDINHHLKIVEHAI